MINQLRKITIATSFPIFPPCNLHSQRIFHLYRHLAENLRIEIISLTEDKDDYFTGIIAPGLSEIRIPKSFAHQQAESEIQQKLGSQESKASLIELCELTPQYLAALQKSAHQAIAIICHQPYLFPVVSKCNKPIWYEATGIESDLQAKLLPKNETGIDLIQSTKQVEKQCFQESDLIITASRPLAQKIAQIHHISSSKILCIPNGINPPDHQFISCQQRLSNKEKLGLQAGFLAIFIGNGNPHNFAEAKTVLNIASKLRKVNFLILGNIGGDFNSRLIPSNVSFIPNLDPEIKSLILDIADIAINPVLHDSDNQAQMIEYLARGIPVVSTPLGIASFNAQENQYCLVGETWQFPALILIAQQETIEHKEMRLKSGKDYVIEEFRWDRIANNLLSLITAKDIAS